MPRGAPFLDPAAADAIVPAVTVEKCAMEELNWPTKNGCVPTYQAATDDPAC